MRRNGPEVWSVCAVCGATVPLQTTIVQSMLPGREYPQPIISVPLIIHLQDGTGGHIAAHPAMTTEQMGTD